MGELMMRLFGTPAEAAEMPPVPGPPPGLTQQAHLPPELQRALAAIRAAGMGQRANIEVGGGWPAAGKEKYGTKAHVPEAVTNPQRVVVRPDVAAGYEQDPNELMKTLLHEFSHVGEMSNMTIPERASLIRAQAAMPYLQRPEEQRAEREANVLLQKLLMERRGKK